jgi:hypothetical protein
MIPQEWLKYAPKPVPLKQGKEWNVFLSYRSVNRAWVLSLYDILKELGHKVFLDQYVLKPGDELITNLEDALDKSMAGILIWSGAAKDSDWVRKEYNTLERKSTDDTDFRFIIIKLDDIQLPVFAMNKIHIDFSNYPDGPNGGDLLRLLHAIVGIPLSVEAVHFANEQDETLKDIMAQIRAAVKNNQPQMLIQLFEVGGLPWETSAVLGCQAAEGLTKLGCKDEAVNLLEQLENSFPKAIRPKQLKALALAKRGNDGDLERAQEILGVLYEKNNLDPETLGIYGRTWMDRYARSNNIADLIQSRDLYAEAFERSPDDYYTGINAASKSVFIGTEKDMEKALDYAAKVQQLVGTESYPGDYWKTATVAELFLIQKKYSEAGLMYEKAVATARTETDSHQSTWKQAIRLMERLKPDIQQRKHVLEAFKHLPGYLGI